VASADRASGHVLITGGSSGLGAAVAEAVDDRGGTPLIIDIKAPSGPWRYEIADLSDSARAEQAVRKLAEDAGGLDAVVTCAGIDAPGALVSTPTQVWERIVAVNLLGTAAAIRAALPFLEQRAGAVVTIASTLGHRVASDATAYCASKFGVVGLTRALMAETQGRVAVTLITPGGMDTAFFDQREPRYQPSPTMRLTDPRRVADAIVVALCQPLGCEIRELVITGPDETSWP
jgi:NAD(P)-dependent dehydrogenase (short-subunit alcohol dehydrogenase family)